MKTVAIDNLVCRVCGLLKSLDEFVKNRRMKRGIDTICKLCNLGKTIEWKKIQDPVKEKERHRKVSARWVEDLKFEVLSHYGVCYCCGESRIEFLTIDHINGDGAVHRKEINMIGYRFYVWLRNNNYPEEFRTACANCNMATRFNKVCPHKLENI